MRTESCTAHRRDHRVHYLESALIWLLILYRPLAATASTTMPADAVAPAARPALKAYCGVRCLYAAALAEGVTFNAEELVRAEYIGSREGSSIEELELAARNHGLHTFGFVNGTVDLLRAAGHPVILHVESIPGSGRYDHFVLYLGNRSGRLLVLDTVTLSGEPAQALNPQDLEMMWDGTGIIVSRSPINEAFLAASSGRLIFCGGAVALAIFIGKRIGFPRSFFLFGHPPSLGVAGQALAILTLALSAPALLAVCTDDGFLAHKMQIRLVEQTHAAYFLPRVSIPEAVRNLAVGSAIFVDARYAADYGLGHIPSAINVPVTASAQSIRLLMSDIRRDVPVIVYCQSKSCPFAKVVATALLQEGYTSIKLLDGGWEEWSAWKH